jgi:hypothetical protein
VNARSPVVDAIDRALDALPADAPLTPVGHRGGRFFVISAHGELRSLSGVNLEAGKGVSELVAGCDAAGAWARGLFPKREEGFDRKALGAWLIAECARAGLFDPSTAVLRRSGVWREEAATAVAHCGDALIYPDGRKRRPGRCNAVASGAIYLAAPATSRPAATPALASHGRELLAQVVRGWGWRRSEDAAAFVGWIGAAMLGGFIHWRPHFAVEGGRGAGKSELAELAARLLGPMAGGGVLNGATEAGLRQARDGTAAALILDEFEADPLRAGALADVLALARRMSGGGGGRVLKGGADHGAQGFTMLGAMALFAITPPPMNAAELSRFVRLQLGPLPRIDPGVAASRLAALRRWAADHQAELWSRALAQAERWDETAAAFAGVARSLGADARQADTVGAVASGLDVLTQDGPPDAQRLAAARPLLAAMLGQSDAAEEDDDGAACLAWLLQQFVASSPALAPRSVADAILDAAPPVELAEARRVLANYGMKVSGCGLWLWVATSHAQLSRLFKESRWHSGGWRGALLSIEGAEAEPNQVRAEGQRFRAVRVPLALRREPGPGG